MSWFPCTGICTPRLLGGEKRTEMSNYLQEAVVVCEDVMEYADDGVSG